MMGKGVSVAGADREEAPGPKPEPLGRRLRLRHQPPRSWQLLLLQRWIGVPDFRAHKSEAQAKGVFKCIPDFRAYKPAAQAKGVFKRIPDFRAYKPEAQAKGVFKRISFNALRLRFRLVASDFPGIVCILDGD